MSATAIMIGGSTLLTLLNDTDEDARLSAELNRELGRFADARAILNRLQPTARLNTPKTLPPNAHDAPLPPSPIFDEEESEEAFRERVIPILAHSVTAARGASFCLPPMVSSRTKCRELSEAG